MSHLPLNSAIFSPSAARAAASAARDWSFVDSWLAARFREQGRPAPPPFERNTDTLRALLALVNLNEAADEDRALLAAAEARALRDAEAWAAEEEEEEKEGGGAAELVGLRADVLGALEEGLTREGRAALDAMAGAAVELGIARPEAGALARELAALRARAQEMERAAARAAVLRRYVDAEAARAAALAEELRGEDYRPPSDLAKNNLETQRRVRAMEARLPELQDKAAALAASAGRPEPTVEQVREEEEEYLALLGRKKELEARVMAFRGLPPDPDAARQELERLRDELERITRQRDAVFESLVERETPRKPRR